MSDVNIKYQGTSIATIDASGSKTLQTSGKYCEGDIVVEYTDPEKPTQAKSATPTETAQDITPDSGKVLSKVSVGAIPKTYVGSGVTKKAAATVSPSTSEQTVCASGVYTTGEQKVSAITPSIVGNLDASSFAPSIVSAIEGKGVNVPDGTLLDGMAELIEVIEAGGGSKKVYIEQKTFASNQTSVKITHNFGELPTIFLQLMIATSSGNYTNKARIGVGYTKDGSTHGTTAYNSSSLSKFSFTDYPPVENSRVYDTYCTFTPCGGNSSGAYYYAGDTYLFALVGGVQL